MYNYDDLREYYNDCSSIVNISPKNKKNSLRILCAQLVKYLKTKYTTMNNEEIKYHCVLLNYWIYSRLVYILRTEEMSVIAPILGEFDLKWNDIVRELSGNPLNNKCIPDGRIITYNDWRNRKELYDYYVDYKYLISMAEMYDHNKCTYYNKIKEKQALFDYFDGLCKSSPDKCPKLYNEHMSYNPNLVLSNLPCHSIMGKERAPPSEGGDVSKVTSSHHPKSLGDGPGLPQLAADSDTQLEYGNSRIGTKVTNSVLGAAPVLLTATMLYRYTPLGPWIRRFRGGRTNNMNTMDTFSPYTPETGDMFSEESANYISYQPM
ncbi:hypothetical protein PVNG_06282 [Plasmodium vivax North Korean]|uniref:VIR protein n=1 Tax=Plasmodium vivax North Korean TaxID=1035514 RepID=A0A0J9TMV9_PLAVI|nr:hypothetical protein PVNG_06282 [Plasmodium vivax North Korean]